MRPKPVEGEVVVTEAGQIVELFALGYSYPQVWPWEPAEFEPVTVVWTDPQNLPKELAGFQDSLSELVCDVALWPLWVVLHPQTGEVAIRYPYSDKEMVRLPVPKGFPAGEIHRALLRETQLLTGMSPLRSWSELVAAGQSRFAPPQITLHAWLGDYRDAPRYWSNQIAWAEAEAAAKWTDPPVFGEVAVESGTGGGGGMMLLMGGGGCAITNDADPFVVVDISPDSNGWVTVTWESCPDHLYQPLTSEDLVQGEWTVRDTLVGQDGFTSWTDTNAPVFEARFYRILRLSGAGDWDGDFWSDSSELNAGYDPMVATDHPAYGFAINGGVDVVSGTQLEVSLLTGIVAQSVIVSESITFEPCVTNTFAESFSYSLVNTNDGLHTVFLRLLNSTGSPSPIFGRSVVLDTAGPTLAITAPTNGVVTGRRRLTVEGFAADANDAHTANDTGKALLVTVNDSFINARDTNGVWWSGAHDLVPGTNTFTVVAADRAGFAVTNAVFVIYDPTLATNVPAFTVDMTNTVVTVASNTTVFAIAGGIDDDNAIVRIDLLDPVDNTITNASVTAAVQGTNWWADVPVLSGSNLVVITAQNASAPPVTNSFLSVQSTNTFLAIASPAMYATANATSITVSGFASENFNGAIKINGQAASKTLVTGGYTFSGSMSINNPGANVIDVEASGSDGSTARARQIVYGYEVVDYRWSGGIDYEHLADDCWYAHHYPLLHPYRTETHGVTTWAAPAATASHSGFYYEFTLDEEAIPCGVCGTSTSASTWDPEWYPYDAGWFRYEARTQGQHLDGAGEWFADCPHQTDCDCAPDPYCPGQSTILCCVLEARERTVDNETRHTEFTFIKHWPTDEEQTVILHLEESEYRTAHGWASDPGKVQLWGQPGIAYSETGWGSTNIGFVVKSRTNTRYTIREGDLTVPLFSKTQDYAWPNAQSRYTSHFTGQYLYFAKIANDFPELEDCCGKAVKAEVEGEKCDVKPGTPKASECCAYWEGNTVPEPDTLKLVYTYQPAEGAQQQASIHIVDSGDESLVKSKSITTGKDKICEWDLTNLDNEQIEVDRFGKSYKASMKLTNPNDEVIFETPELPVFIDNCMIRLQMLADIRARQGQDGIFEDKAFDTYLFVIGEVSKKLCERVKAWQFKDPCAVQCVNRHISNDIIDQADDAPNANGSGFAKAHHKIQQLRAHEATAPAVLRAQQNKFNTAASLLLYGMAENPLRGQAFCDCGTTLHQADQAAIKTIIKGELKLRAIDRFFLIHVVLPTLTGGSVVEGVELEDWAFSESINYYNDNCQ